MTVIIKQCKNDYQINVCVSNFEIVKIAYITSHRVTPTQKHIPILCVGLSSILDRIHVMYVAHQIELESVENKFPKNWYWIFVPGMMVLKLTYFVIFPAKILQSFQMGDMNISV